MHVCVCVCVCVCMCTCVHCILIICTRSIYDIHDNSTEYYVHVCIEVLTCHGNHDMLPYSLYSIHYMHTTIYSVATDIRRQVHTHTHARTHTHTRGVATQKELVWRKGVIKGSGMPQNKCDSPVQCETSSEEPVFPVDHQ